MFKKNKNSQAPPISGRVLLTLPYVYVYPDELLEGLCIAISCDSLKFVSLSTNDINLYSLHRKDNSFIASCYAVKYGDLYYGNIIGSKDIFSFLPDDFIIKQTSELLAPLKIDSNA